MKHNASYNIISQNIEAKDASLLRLQKYKKDLGKQKFRTYFLDKAPEQDLFSASIDVAYCIYRCSALDI